jgi:hypothetical protein
LPREEIIISDVFVGVDEAGDDSIELPLEFVATTVKVYVTPLVNPGTTIGDVVSDAVIPPGLAVAVYEVIGEPPTLVGGVKLTATNPLPGVADIPVGASGAVPGVPETVADAALTPIALTALSCTLYVVPLVNPVMTTGLIFCAGETAVKVVPPSVEYW